MKISHFCVKCANFWANGQTQKVVKKWRPKSTHSLGVARRPTEAEEKSEATK